MMLIVMVIEVFYSFVIFITCEMGEQLKSKYEDIEHMIGQLDWYLVPAEVQRILPTIIINAQKSVTFEIFASTDTSRESFQTVRSD